MLFIQSLYADYGGQVGYAVPIQQWEWNANRGVGVLYECLDSDSKVLFRRKTEMKMNEVDFYYEDENYHYIDFPMLVNSTCNSILSTLYISDGSTAQKCNMTTQPSLDDCDLSQQGPASNSTGEDADKDSSGGSKYPDISEMSEEQKKEFAEFARSNYEELKGMSDEEVLQYLTDNPDAKEMVDQDITSHITDEGGAINYPAIEDMSDSEKDSYAEFAKASYKELTDKTNDEILKYLSDNSELKAIVDPDYYAKYPEKLNTASSTDDASIESAGTEENMNADQQLAYAQFAVDNFEELSKTFEESKTKYKELNPDASSTDIDAEGYRSVLKVLNSDTKLKEQVDEKVKEALKKQKSGDDQGDGQIGLPALKKRSDPSAGDESECGLKRTVLQVTCPEHGLDGLDKTFVKVINDPNTTELTAENPADQSADELIPAQ